MKYEIRNLCSKDIFPMSKILSKIGFAQLKECFEADEIKKISKSKDVEVVGMTVMMNFAGIIIGNLPNCETELYKFLSDLTGAKVEELKEISLADFAELIIEIVKKDDFKDFIGVVSRLFK